MSAVWIAINLVGDLSRGCSNFTCLYSRDHLWAWKSCGRARPSTWETTPMTSCPSWLTRTRATCTQQVTRPNIYIKKKKLLLFWTAVSTLASRWVWEVLQWRGAHGSLGRTAGGEWFRAVSVPAVFPSLSFYTNLFLLFFVFQLRALTQVLQLPIEVVQASSAAIKIGEEFDREPITLVYVNTSFSPSRSTQLHAITRLLTWPFAWTHVQVYASRVRTRRALQFCGAAKGHG